MNEETGASLACDKLGAPCRDGDKHQERPTLPTWARLPINRCNLPAVILGSLTYQLNPSPLVLDGVAELHRKFLAMLQSYPEDAVRERMFHEYMTVSFCLDALDEAGFDLSKPKGRGRLDYLKLIRGWHFNSDAIEGAVLKSWVESRFGLLPRHHRAPIRDFSGEAYRLYLEQRATGLYNTNALESQLDLLYTWTQVELVRRHPGVAHFQLYRGLNRWEAHEMLGEYEGQQLVLLNSLNSFSLDRERAGEFGDRVIVTEVPLSKVLCSAALLPGKLQGEGELLALGGVYAVRMVRG